MNALQRASLPFDHTEVSDGGSKTIDVPLIMRNITDPIHVYPKPVPRITVAPHIQGIITEVSI